jgi:hypothetical protein
MSTSTSIMTQNGVVLNVPTPSLIRNYANSYEATNASD